MYHNWSISTPPLYYKQQVGGSHKGYRPVCSMHIDCVRARLLQLAWITDPVLCMCVPFVCYSVARGCYMFCNDGRVHATASYVTRFAKRNHIPYLKCIYCKEAYCCNAMHNLNQMWVFIEEALLQQWCGNKVLGLHHQGVTGLSSQHFRLQWGFWKMVPHVPGMEGAHQISAPDLCTEWH